MNVAVYGCIGGKYGMADSGFGDSGGTSTTSTMDSDGDGQNDNVDCADDNPNVYVGAAENESRDQCTEDADDDGWAAETVTESNAEPGTDCDDTNAAIHPGALETPGDGVDSNCDGNDDT